MANTWEPHTDLGSSFAILISRSHGSRLLEDEYLTVEQEIDIMWSRYLSSIVLSTDRPRGWQLACENLIAFPLGALRILRFVPSVDELSLWLEILLCRRMTSTHIDDMAGWPHIFPSSVFKQSERCRVDPTLLRPDCICTYQQKDILHEKRESNDASKDNCSTNLTQTKVVAQK